MSKKTYDSWEMPKIFISIPKEYHDQISNISHNTGESIAALIRPKIREIINSFPEETRNTRKKID